jgi:anti-sigma28 factor (negative regulator of flagellin synthesis)
MDPTKTNSYRRWRNKLSSKGFSRTFLSTDASFKGAGSGRLKDQKANKILPFNSLEDEIEVQALLKELEREFRKSEYFRKEKVAEIKNMIKKGIYLIPGKMVIDKWFPE